MDGSSCGSCCRQQVSVIVVDLYQQLFYALLRCACSGDERRV